MPLDVEWTFAASHQQQRHSCMAINTYEAVIKLPSGGQTKVTIQSDSWDHARQLLHAQYGANNVMNLHQK